MTVRVAVRPSRVATAIDAVCFGWMWAATIIASWRVTCDHRYGGFGCVAPALVGHADDPGNLGHRVVLLMDEGGLHGQDGGQVPAFTDDPIQPTLSSVGRAAAGLSGVSRPQLRERRRSTARVLIESCVSQDDQHLLSMRDPERFEDQTARLDPGRSGPSF